MINFLKDNIKIYGKIEDKVKCGVDRYGKARTCLQLKASVKGDLQELSPSEKRQAPGNRTINTHHLYLNPGVKIGSNDVVKADGYNGFFEVVGEPMVRKIIPHIHVLLYHLHSPKKMEGMLRE